MQFGPFELQACGENDYTMKTLGLLAFRADLRERLVCRLLGDGAIKPGDQVSILFFARIGLNFFREAIEREYVGDVGDLLLRCNQALGLPSSFRWRRNVDGRLTQPANWKPEHIQAMLEDNGRSGDMALQQLLGSIQDDLNTEPDVVLQWGNRIAIIEIKVLSGQGVSQVDRQRRLADFLAAITGLERADLFLLGPAGCKPPTDPSCRLLSWKQLADWFDDVPEIAEYIRHSAFFYGGSWRTMLSPVAASPGATAWDLMLSTPVVASPADPPNAPGSVISRQASLSRSGGMDANGSDIPEDPWAFQRLGYEYFAPIIEGCSRNGIWPLKTIWTGVTGAQYSNKTKVRRIDPNWMVEDANGERYTRSGGFAKPHRYNAGRMRGWPYEQIAAFFGFPLG
jgi:hypothetical protein